MAQQLKLFLFGDQTYDIKPHLKDLALRPHNAVLDDFLGKAYDAIRAEVYQLPRDIRSELPRFTCVDDVLMRKLGGRRCVPLDMAVTCMYQVATFIGHIDSGYPNGDMLVPLGVAAVVAAFKTGVRVMDVAARLHESASDSSSDSNWSMAVAGSEAAEAVATFCKQTTLPFAAQPYISAHLPTGASISGPPHALARLTSSASFQGLQRRCHPLRIFGPYHAPHLYSQDDVDDIVASALLSLNRLGAGAHDARRSHIAVLSAKGFTAEGASFEALLNTAVGDILVRPLSWAELLQHLRLCLQAKGATSLTTTAFGSRADQLIYNALKHTPPCELLPPPPPPSPLHRDTPHEQDHGKPKLAIIAMSGRFPGAQDNEAFWNVLHQGLDVHKPVPALHWDEKTHVDPTGARKNTAATPFGCWLEDPAGFDARFFNISPREAPQIDPAQRLALMTAYEAIEQAGIIPDATPSTRRDRVGVFYGVTSNDWMETNSAQNIDTYLIPGGNRAFIPGRINYFFKFSGPSYAVDTACSSSLAGIHLACNSLWRRDIDTAIAGGTNVLTNPDFTAGLDRGHFLSRTGNCKTFDDSADGYCRGEGVGTVIIKRLDDAIADKDPILGVILGAYTNHSAESESITRPHVGAQRDIFNKILNQAAVDPYTVSYIEMHGTGTQAGDAGEMTSVLDTFAPPLSLVNKGRSRDEALYLGSAKANIGHGEAASGVSSLIKVLLMMQKNTIVPHCGIKTKINHRFPTDLHERNVNIALQPTPWERSSDPNKPRRVFVNNFSAAGGNSAVLIEDAPLAPEQPGHVVDSRAHQVVAISAKNGVSLQGNLRSMLKYLQQHPHVDLGKLSYTTTARRLHHPHRVMLAGSTTQELCAQIEAALSDQLGMTRSASAPKIVFTFTGQGAQYPGMGKLLFESFSLFRTEILRLDQIAQSLGFPSVLPVIQSEEQDIAIFAPAAVQLANTCFQIALSRLWASWNVFPTAVVGHSLGEYAALNVAGVLSDVDTVHLVGKRARLMEEKCERDTHMMLVVKGSVDDIAAVLGDKTYEIACINSPTETVLAGPKENISLLRAELTDARVKTTLLHVSYAFHSSQLDPILADYEKVANDVVFSTNKIPVICPLDGTVVLDDGGKFGPTYLVNHSRQPVNMINALLAAQSQGIITDKSVMLEIGPHPAISSMIKGVLGSHMTSLSSAQRGRPAFHILAATLKTLYTSGADIHWSSYHHDFKTSHQVLPLPAYSWDLKEYWIQYVNDWSLRKGDPPLVAAAAPTLESTTIHRIVEESGDSGRTHIVVEADIARADLSPLVQGHEVDGIPLCTPSVYADIALSLGTYLLKRHRPDTEANLVDVSDMTISKALILRDGATQQLLQAHADVDWSSNTASIRFMSFDSHQKLQEHSRCVLRFKDRSLRKQLEENVANFNNKMQALRDGVAKGISARFNRPMVYRAIRPLARFHDDYRAINEIILNSNTLEAISHLSFETVKRGGHYHTHPAIIDSLTQSCGFTMNCNDAADLDVEVFMNHGWGSFQIFEPLDFDKKYTTYTQMAEGSDKLWHGDVVIFDDDRVVAFFGQIAIQGVPRRVLKVILSIESGKGSQKQQHGQKKQSLAINTPSTPATHIRAATKIESHAPKIAHALSIIAEESGIAVTELTDSTVFADVGIDSLLGLTVSARFKEELDVDLDFNAMFFECPTVGDLKKVLQDGDSSSSDSSGTSSPRMSSATGATTPVSIDEAPTPKVEFGRALQIVSEESGVAMGDLTDDADFADAGVDSLLSLIIVSRLRDELEINIQHESLFLECPTVGDLKRLLLGDAKGTSAPLPANGPLPIPTSIPVKMSMSSNRQSKTEEEDALLKARREAVEGLVRKYTTGFTVPSPQPLQAASSDVAGVVLVTGASGSLGSHLVDHIAQLPGVDTVVCLNREKNEDPYVRQQKAMRAKGIRSFDKIRPKLLVLQADSSKPMLGLTSSQYEGLIGSVTHIIHNAWPMSAKRPLAGFEPQFQVMRNLIDLASTVVSQRPADFKFSFQLVSSVGVVGHYERHSREKKILVPEERVGIESVLPNGYGDAKWGCERMLDETLHKHADKFRTMAVRLGQIAGSKTSGYWNPMEHFGFLIKSSQTLNALPDVDGTVYWTPVNDIAATLSDLVLSDRPPYPIYHIENPVGQPWREMNAVLADALHIPNLIPFEEWVERVRTAPQRNNPAANLLDFLDDNYLRMSCGGLVLDVKKTLEHSETLAAVGPVNEEV
ncbi:Type I Iterative Polyketide synthase [Pyrenophora tritici-repentis]|nr:Type I Iterative Polyketide synthase [Pyrenophora tritici-repentis]